MSNMNNNAMTENAPKKNVGYRLFAVLLVAVCALAALVLKFNVINTKTTTVDSLNLLAIITDLFVDKTAIQVTGTVGTVYTYSAYAFVAGLVVATAISFLAIFTAKKAPAFVRTALFFLSAGAMAYAIAFTLAIKTYVANNTFGSADSTMDIFSLAIAGAAAFLYFLFATKKAGKVAVLYFFQAILSVAVLVLFAGAIADSQALAAEEADLIAVAAVAVFMLNAMISIGRMTKAGGIVFDLVRYIVVLLVALLAIAKVSTELYAIVAAAIVVLQIIIAIVQLVKSKNVDVDSIREEAAMEATSGFHTEEYVEACPYEGGPVAGVLMAEEVNPSFLPHEPHVTTAGYDFYNTKSFDPFIATLSDNERNEFTELFILKFKGTMPELPDYVVGGDNKEFFRKIFIYLGQYRDRMSQALLAKMYQFSMKI